MRNRQYDFHIFLNESEFQKLDELSRTSGLNHSAVIRKLIMSKEIRQRPSADFMALARSIDKLGNNFNQLVRKVHSTNTVMTADMTLALQIMKRVNDEINDWKRKWL